MSRATRKRAAGRVRRKPLPSHISWTTATLGGWTLAWLRCGVCKTEERPRLRGRALIERRQQFAEEHAHADGKAGAA